MTVFNTQFAANAAPGLFGLFSEQVVYRPLGGTPRTITALVRREQQRSVEGLTTGTTSQFAVVVYNDATTGILATGIDRGGDMIDVASTYGGTAIQRRIYKILNTDAGMVEFEVR